MKSRDKRKKVDDVEDRFVATIDELTFFHTFLCFRYELTGCNN